MASKSHLDSAEKFGKADYGRLRTGGGYIATATIFLNILALALPLALLQIYDRIIPNSSTGTLLLLLGGVISAVVLEGLLRVARADIVGWIGVQFEHAASCRAFAHVFSAPAD
ncbi:MAG: ABC transporter permease, partial [Magnetospirillum sp.]